VGTLTGKDAGISAMGALMVNWARDLVSDKLPVDSFSVASDSLRTGKYLTDKIFVGYTRRFEARPEKGENPDEVRVEYQITPRWQLESRYGNAQSGGASLIWSRDY
jgi:translocation and assembly module TamB